MFATKQDSKNSLIAATPCHFFKVRSRFFWFCCLYLNSLEKIMHADLLRLTPNGSGRVQDFLSFHAAAADFNGARFSSARVLNPQFVSVCSRPRTTTRKRLRSKNKAPIRKFHETTVANVPDSFFLLLLLFLFRSARRRKVPNKAKYTPTRTSKNRGQQKVLVSGLRAASAIARTPIRI